MKYPKIRLDSAQQHLGDILEPAHHRWTEALKRVVEFWQNELLALSHNPPGTGARVNGRRVFVG